MSSSTGANIATSRSETRLPAGFNRLVSSNLLAQSAEQIGLAYFPTYAIVLTFLIMVLVLAVRPQGLLAGR